MYTAHGSMGSSSSLSSSPWVSGLVAGARKRLGHSSMRHATASFPDVEIDRYVCYTCRYTGTTSS